MIECDDMNKESWEESFAEQSADWMATSAIYADSIHPPEPLFDDTNYNNNNNNKKQARRFKGFYGCITIKMSTATTAFFRSIDNDGNFRYFSLSTQPQLLLKFKYLLPGLSQEEDGCQENNNYTPQDCNESAAAIWDGISDVTPTLVSVSWVQYPEEWPEEDKKPLLASIWEESNRILQEEQLSFPVCEYCEHQAVTQYQPWKLFHKADPFRLIRVPHKLDSMYHHNVGYKLHPQKEARMLSSTTSTSSTDGHPTKRSNHNNNNHNNNNNRNKQLHKEQFVHATDKYARATLIRHWEKLYTAECPICFDSMHYSDGVTLPSCQHFVCDLCLEQMLHFKVQELSSYRTNPFACPVEKCRQELSISNFVSKYLPTEEMQKVHRWKLDLEHPPCFSLDRCLSKICGAKESLRRQSKNSTNIFCEQCNKHWCELCLKRYQVEEDEMTHVKERCDDVTAWTFCRRYLAASEEKKRACEQVYPWIASYARFREHDGDAVSWILQNGQVCPNCRTGIERLAGCFHMQCTNCATHFCYECGEELFPPYYGTHHCWERSELALEL